jgi:hypothetical protein
VTLSGIKKQREEALAYLEEKDIKVNPLLSHNKNNQVNYLEKEVG